jgi:hypothetical protein
MTKSEVPLLTGRSFAGARLPRPKVRGHDRLESGDYGHPLKLPRVSLPLHFAVRERRRVVRHREQGIARARLGYATLRSATIGYAGDFLHSRLALRRSPLPSALAFRRQTDGRRVARLCLSVRPVSCRHLAEELGAWQYRVFRSPAPLLEPIHSQFCAGLP